MRVNGLVRVGLFGICMFGLLAGSIGCSALRNQFPSKRFARPYTPPEPQPVVMAPTVESDAFVYPALDNLPADVQASILRDHPQGGITRIEQVPSGAGPMLYRVSAMQDGAATVSSYRSNGADLNPRGVIIYGGDDSGRPKAKYAPTPEAGIPEKRTPPGTVD